MICTSPNPNVNFSPTKNIQKTGGPADALGTECVGGAQVGASCVALGFGSPLEIRTSNFQ